MRGEKSRAAMLYEIGMLGFAVVEMTEYLDTHPQETEAIEYLKHFLRLKNQMEKEYSYLYEPLNISYAESSGNTWKWALAPMPWEGGCA
jgi:spore coat protein JB